MSRLRVIVVEDDDFTRSTVISALQMQGMDVVGQAAAIGPAMKFVQVLRPDAVIVDLDLGSGPTGMDFAIAVRKNYPGTGIVILTTFEDPRLLHPKIPSPPIGTEYLVKRAVGDVELLSGAILKSIKNVSKGNKVSNKNPVSPKLEGVTDSQLETMRLIAQGKSNKEIAKIRSVTEKSVEQTISRLVTQLKLPKSAASNQRVQISKLYFSLTGSKSARDD
ncbi:MAG: response regulator [Actinomycetales bacterium]